MKAKPTLYDGIRFRSRLEARWAVFMDALAPRFWTYEPDVPVAGYQPDFEIWSAYLEIKPDSWADAVPEGSTARFRKLTAATGKPLHVCVGEPGRWEHGKLISGTRVATIEPDGHISASYWAECPSCGSIRIVRYGESVCETHQVLSQLKSAFAAVRDASYVDAP